MVGKRSSREFEQQELKSELKKIGFKPIATLPLLAIALAGCGGANFGGPAFTIEFRVGSALKHLCADGAERFNRTKPKLDNGQSFQLTCTEMGSGDVVTSMLDLANGFQNGAISADDPSFPTLLSVDGEVFLSQLGFQMDALFPGQNYIPDIPDAPLIANSPMVFMVPDDLAAGLQSQDNIFAALVDAENHTDLDSSSRPLPISFVQTAPTRSNSGLQTLISQFASVSDRPPEQLTSADIQRYQADVQQIQSKVTRYGASTSTLARDAIANGPFWASIASVYESSVIAANSEAEVGGTRYQAVYPQDTFTSNMRAILPNAPWVSDDEREAALQVIDFFRSDEIQRLATEQGLRPGVPGIPLGPKFTERFGVDPSATYNSLRPPAPDVVDMMLRSWQDFAKRPSQVVVVVDSSGSMEGVKLSAVQSTLSAYIDSLGPQEEIVLVDFDESIRQPILVDSSQEGRARGYQFVTGLRADGGTRLYDATIAARDYLLQNARPEAINAVIVLTDGEDSGSQLSFDVLNQELQQTGFAGDARIAVFTVGYSDRGGGFNPRVLEDIASVSGGYYREGDPSSISRLMADLQVEF